MNVILSIKPKYVESIVNGQKQFEFRKSIFKDRSVERVYIYATSPVMRIIGYFIIEDIFEKSPENLWIDFHTHAGIDEREFFHYFSNKDTGYAIGIRDVHTFEEPLDPRESIPGFHAPQNFMYAPDDFHLSH